MHNFIFQHPGMGSFGIFLDISRYDGIAPPAYRHVERWPGPARILKARRKPDVFDELFGLRGRFYMSLAVALPMRVTVLFDLGGSIGKVHKRHREDHKKAQENGFFCASLCPI